jgi:hypothetical protein
MEKSDGVIGIVDLIKRLIEQLLNASSRIVP